MRQLHIVWLAIISRASDDTQHDGVDDRDGFFPCKFSALENKRDVVWYAPVYSFPGPSIPWLRQGPTVWISSSCVHFQRSTDGCSTLRRKEGNMSGLHTTWYTFHTKFNTFATAIDSETLQQSVTTKNENNVHHVLHTKNVTILSKTIMSMTSKREGKLKRRDIA